MTNPHYTNYEEFVRLTDEQLRQLADECLKKFQASRSPVRDTPLILQAQLYMNELSRREDTVVAHRDYRMATESHTMEKWVIGLIGLEIVLSIAGIGIGLYESSEQAKVLSSVGVSTSSTATAMKDAATSLKTLADQQTAAVTQLQQMNSALQDSLSRTKAMAEAGRKQVKILETEQNSRLSELAKQPKLALYIASTPANTIFVVHLKPRQETDTESTYDVTLVNEGERIATRPLLRVMINSKDVAVTSETNIFQKVSEPEGVSAHVFLTVLDNIRPHVRVQMLLTFTYPKGQPPFDVAFGCDADEIQTGTPLGLIRVNPKKPSD